MKRILSTPADYSESLVERNGRLYYMRFSVAQRVQHILLVIFFSLLLLTGIPLMVPDAWIVEKVFSQEGIFLIRGKVHRWAAVGLILLALYHLLYCLFSSRGRSDLVEMIPAVKDVKDFFAAVAYKLSRREETPRFSRFDYIEKFEYFSVVWGCVIMIITGAALWFPEKATLLFPLWVLEILRVIHGYEAVLAGLAIIIWHMYHANLKPSVFPMSKVWLNGLITLEELHENHPLEFESLLAVLPSKTVGRIKKQMG